MVEEEVVSVAEGAVVVVVVDDEDYESDNKDHDQEHSI